ncbi:MAG: glycosyltransferase family 39 protein [Candidatus Caldarchaeum sp.]
MQVQNLLAIMKDISKRYAVIFILALGLRLSLFAYVVWVTDRGVFDFYSPDARGYDRLAMNLLDHGVFSESPTAPFEPALYRTPVYPAFLACVYALVGHNINIAVMIQFVLGAMMAVITAHLGRKLFGDTAGVIAGFIVALDLLSMSLQLALMSETVFTLLLLVSVSLLVQYLKTEDRRPLVASALLYGLTVLCRPVAQWFFLAIIGLLFLRFRPAWAKVFQASAVFLLVYAATIAPWIVRNYRVAGFVGLSALSEIQLITWAAAIEGELRGLVLGSNYHEFEERLRKQASEQNLGAAETLAFERRVAWQMIKDHPRIALKLPIAGFFRLFPGVTGVGIWGYSDEGTGAVASLLRGDVGEAIRRVFSQGVMRVVHLVGQYAIALMIWAAALYGLWRSRRIFTVRDNPTFWLALPILYFILISLGPNAYSRLLVPVIPFIAIMAGYGISEYYSRRAAARTERGHRINELSTA